jgi:hypothetical protein
MLLAIRVKVSPHPLLVAWISAPKTVHMRKAELFVTQVLFLAKNLPEISVFSRQHVLFFFIH